MSLSFQSLKVARVVRETPDCVSLLFEVPDTLREQFRFREGQNLTLRQIIGGEEVRRSYSLCTAPYENQLKIAVKKIQGGRFSTFVNDTLQAGDVLDVMPPSGHFRAHIGESGGSYLALAAGSGITPVLSIIKHTLAEDPRSRFTLVYGSRNRAHVIFFEELELLKNRYMNRFNLIHVLSREKTDSPVNYGRIDPDKLSSLDKIIEYGGLSSAYLCGPEEMIFSARDFLQARGLDAKRIHFELFTAPGSALRSTSQTQEAEAATGPSSKITLRLDGRSFSFDLPRGGASILDAALQQGADLPYACKGGVCCTCKAKLIEGQVRMDVNYSLEPEEVEQGYILTCQSHPLTEEVTVDFDQR